MEKKLSIGRINQVEIFAISTDSGEILVPIKPICTALGVAFQSQNNKIKEHKILSSVVTLSITTGTDGKQYEMVCLPLKFIYGWLFSINPSNVSEEAREQIQNYQMQCYETLYSHFFLRSEKQLEANKAEIKELELITSLLTQEKELRSQLKEARARLSKIRSARLDDQPTLF